MSKELTVFSIWLFLSSFFSVLVLMEYQGQSPRVHLKPSLSIEELIDQWESGTTYVPPPKRNDYNSIATLELWI